MIRFVSTRGFSAPLSFADLLFATTAQDGGLYMPTELPHFGALLPEWQHLSYQGLTTKILQPFAQDALPPLVLADLVRRAYAGFRHPEITPVHTYAEYNLLELFHGPTYAFKDLALQFLGQLFEYFLSKQDNHKLFLGSTSGDTGSAAIYAVRGKKNMKLIMLHPHNRVSPVQAKQMLTVIDPNIINLAVQGDFDACQSLVKKLFAEVGFPEKHHLGAVNSINLVRVLAQIPYYFYAYFRHREISKQPFVVSVPSGNFGNFFAGYLASLMGLPIDQIVIASNQNNILTRFFRTGEYKPSPVAPTISPSMDIQVASNLERFLWLLYDQDGAQVAKLQKDLATQGFFRVDKDRISKARVPIAVGFASEYSTRQRILHHFQTEKDYLDPHTAVGAEVALELGFQGATVLATAHPAKFYDTLEEILGQNYPLPAGLKNLFDLPSKSLVIPAAVDEVRALVENF